MSSYAYDPSLLSSVSPAKLLPARTEALLGVDFMFDFDDLGDNTLTDGGWSPSAGIAVSATIAHTWTFPNTNFSLLQKSPVVVANAATTKWHIAARMKFLTALAAGDRIGANLGTGAFTDMIEVGTHQATSGTKFVFSLGKANVFVRVASTITFDTTAFHTFEMWFDGTSVYGRVDNETPILVGLAANCPTALALVPIHGVVVTGSGAGPVMAMDYVYTAAARV